MSGKRQSLIDRVATEVTKGLVDRGKLVEAGFELFAGLVIPKGAPDIQLREMRLAFMAGADHVFSSIMTILDPGEEPTDADERRMTLISRELEVWRAQFSERVQPAKGRA